GQVDKWTLNWVGSGAISQSVDLDQNNTHEYVYIDSRYTTDLAGAPLITQLNVYFDNGTSYVKFFGYDIFGLPNHSGITWFDALGRTDYVSFTYADKTALTTDYDQANSFSWNTIDYVFDSTQKLDTITVTNDDHTSYKIDYDQKNLFEWSSIIYNLDEQGRRTDLTVNYDNGG